MSVWSGWQSQLLRVATVPDSADNRAFLSDWHSHAESNCRLNPVDISLPVSGSSNCKQIGQVGTHAQNYASRDQAAGQFRAQLRSGRYPHLVAALESGHPYDVSDAAAVKVQEDLQKWGSVSFDQFYAARTYAASGGDVAGPNVHRGYKDLRRSVNQRVPHGLREGQRFIDAALRELGRTHKVGR